MQYSAENLLVKPATNPADPGLILSVTTERAGWDYIHFEARRLAQGVAWSFPGGDYETAFVNFSGRYTIESARGVWHNVGSRKNVFSGAGHVLYLPRQTPFTVRAEETGEFAATWVPTDEDHAPFLTEAKNVRVSVRGGDNATRQINDLLPPGSPVHRLVLVEVYTPSGSWSSYPPHKHDVHEMDASGQLLEADLEEVYFYKIAPPEGYAIQRVYTGASSPLQQAGLGFDALVRAEDNHAVLVPEGYHPVASPPGYCMYYLNVLAGSAQCLANRDDPRFTWVKDSYRTVDSRLPLY